jgi:hypothetical protein
MWGNGILIVGGMVIMVGVVNLLLLVEFPAEKGITIDENSNILELNHSEKTKVEVS